MIMLRWCIGILLACLLAAPAFSAGVPALSAADFLKQPYRGFTLDKASNKSAADFDDLAAMGVNLVRIGINLERCAKCKAYAIPRGSLAEVDQVVSLAETRHIHVILTLEPEMPKGAAYWVDASLQTSIIDIWSSLAERYKNNPAMGGFDLINQPDPPGSLNRASRRYADFAGRLIEAVRKIDPQRMIVYEPAPRGSSTYGFKALGSPLPYNNVLYSIHFYQPASLTHQGLYDKWPYGVSYPTSDWNKARLSQDLEPVREFVRKYKLPIYVGEFSCVRNAPDGSAYRWIRDASDLFEAEGWSWTFHGFRGSHLWNQELLAGAPKPASAAAAASMRSINTPTMILLRGYIKKNKSSGS